jgi:serine/threonine protein kinase
MPPPRLGRYEVRAKIADGGMAALYVARRDDGEIVALKMIRDEFARNDEFLTMLLDEAKIVAHLRHPNIVSYHELCNEGGKAFIAMELLFGQSLWSVWDACRQRGVRLRYDMIAWVGARVCDALHYAHELRDAEGAQAGHDRALGIVHRDVNATNIFVTYDGVIKVIDFGLAKAANRASKTAAGVIKGKVAYMSPEQAVGAPVDRRTDVFALGATLWELACDRRLFKQADDVDTLKRVHAAEVPDPTLLVDGFPPALWHVLRRALARDAEDRYSTAAEMGRDLDGFASAGAGVDAQVVAEVMQELFAEERARQAKWISDVSAPGADPRSVTAPLQSRSTFWAGEEERVAATPTIPPPPGLAPAAVPPSTVTVTVTAAPAPARGPEPRPGLARLAGLAPSGPALPGLTRLGRKLVPIVLAIVVVVALVILGALALR